MNIGDSDIQNDVNEKNKKASEIKDTPKVKYPTQRDQFIRSATLDNHFNIIISATVFIDTSS